MSHCGAAGGILPRGNPGRDRFRAALAAEERRTAFKRGSPVGRGRERPYSADEAACGGVCVAQHRCVTGCRRRARTPHWVRWMHRTPRWVRWTHPMPHWGVWDARVRPPAVVPVSGRVGRSWNAEGPRTTRCGALPASMPVLLLLGSRRALGRGLGGGGLLRRGGLGRGGRLGGGGLGPRGGRLRRGGLGRRGLRGRLRGGRLGRGGLGGRLRRGGAGPRGRRTRGGRLGGGRPRGGRPRSRGLGRRGGGLGGRRPGAGGGRGGALDRGGLGQLLGAGDDVL